MNFLAIDFETADKFRDSACALGIARVEDGRLVDNFYHLIRPPRKKFAWFCTRVHGIRWKNVADEPDFLGLWPEIAQWFKNIDFVAAHNASFDSSVLKSCCLTYDISPPRTNFLCTVRLARKTWDLESAKLNNVCSHLGLPLEHHHAGSDALACANIVLQAIQEAPETDLTQFQSTYPAATRCENPAMQKRKKKKNHG